MELPFESATNDLRRDLGDKNYTVLFDTETQRYNVYYKYDHYNEPTMLTDFANWGIEYGLILDYLRMIKWESQNGIMGLQNKELAELLRNKREAIDAAHDRNDVTPWAQEVAHDIYHASGKRVF